MTAISAKQSLFLSSLLCCCCAPEGDNSAELRTRKNIVDCSIGSTLAHDGRGWGRRRRRRCVCMWRGGSHLPIPPLVFFSLSHACSTDIWGLQAERNLQVFHVRFGLVYSPAAVWRADIETCVYTSDWAIKEKYDYTWFVNINKDIYIFVFFYVMK